MKVLIIGSGGREHALAWKVAQSDQVEKVFVAPGNAGTALEPKTENIPIKADNLDELVSLAKEKKIDLTMIGPEAPLVDGIVDIFVKAGLKCFGPSRYAAQLEGSKAFANDFMARHHIPTGAYKAFTDLDQAKAYLSAQKMPVVVKADGLAAGKGVIICQTQEEALEHLEGMLSGRSFGEAGQRVVIEEFLTGEEASFIVMVDGKNILPLATSQDHKAVYDGDSGPNTGGMGAYSPAPVITPQIYDRVMKGVIEPTVQGMAAEGHPYLGFLYAGLMIDQDGTPNVLEFNCRFGDPETQPILLRLKSDFIELVMAAMDQRLDQVEAQWDERASLGVVMAAGGYPTSYKKGHSIKGLSDMEEEGIKIFHAGTTLQDDQVLTSGGRVLCVTALGSTVKEAQARAYGRIKHISWEDVYYRTDIGYRAVLRETGK
jgi:phosphoribosylamine--glycine ligase